MQVRATVAFEADKPSQATTAEPEGAGIVREVGAGQSDVPMDIDGRVTHTMSLDEINHGFDLMHEGKSIRSVVLYQ